MLPPSATLAGVLEAARPRLDPPAAQVLDRAMVRASELVTGAGRREIEPSDLLALLALALERVIHAGGFERVSPLCEVIETLAAELERDCSPEIN